MMTMWCHILVLITVWLSTLGSAASQNYTYSSTAGTDALAAEGLMNLAAYERGRTQPKSCALETASVRYEWSSLPDGDKRAYIKAVQCLMRKPSISGNLAPGARSRYDDFVATHINQTLTIHATGNFLSWHRYYIHVFEKALHEECKYPPHLSLPYYNWGLYASSILSAPIWSGSAVSMGGNGVYETHVPLYFPSAADPIITVPPSVGGGCVVSGPWAEINYTVNLGPIAPVYTNITTNPLASGLGYDPRCQRRDISQFCAGYTADNYSTALIADSPDIATFQTVLQGQFDQGKIGLHTAGHFIVGGDPGGDFFASPGDPFFWLHHGQVDRIWWIWQNLGLGGNGYNGRENGSESRLRAIAGTITFENVPPSRDARLNDTIDIGVNAGTILISDAMSTLDGPFCYIYR